VGASSGHYPALAHISGAMPISPNDAVRSLWQSQGLPEAALDHLQLSGSEPALASSFAVGTAAQAALGAAALAATTLGRIRNGLAQSVAVDIREAAIECCGRFFVDGHAEGVGPDRRPVPMRPGRPRRLGPPAHELRTSSR
jgi:hypothetical protein